MDGGESWPKGFGCAWVCGECVHAMYTGSEGRAHKHTILTTGAHLFVLHMCRVVRICEKGVSNVSQKLAIIGCTSREYARMR